MTKFAVILVIALMPALAVAQTYHIDWYVIGSGGGHSQSASYQLDGTIGQPIVGHSSSPSYQIDAGFWTGVVTGPSGCIYVIGDANNSNTFTGLDVTYSVRY
ncbi:MAG TPA: hypothetical protein DEO84_09195, partial [candidate division Zixibacteria bacterium]|nr:hypothetical protein [candidate division Zixibacteria bacterium]